ncbi:hypothetical protein N0V88_004074 [Collariella sp. IMI 366227]|nr:hypothetical protein N0V88_004074 [Collariella sp. IMI 366227]
MADSAETDRPSFTAFWRKSKEVSGAKGIRFVEDKNGTRSGSAETGTSQDKAQHRRAQVRKAQIQHRQRKVNYVKQLEADIAEVRAMIEAAEKETQVLMVENRSIKEKLQQGMDARSTALTLDQGVSLLKQMPDLPQLSSEIEDGEVTMSFGFDEFMGAPTYYVSSMPSSSNSPRSSPTEEDPDDLPNLTPAQTQAAINFILA